MLESVTELIGQHGGLGGLLEKLKANGLGDAVSSWVETGDNQPVPPNQLESAIGADAINQITEKLGIPKGQASSLLAQYLPMVIDRLTPHGKLEEAT
jgi:uncharacterized protein YidB (DUF937 family)